MSSGDVSCRQLRLPVYERILCGVFDNLLYICVKKHRRSRILLFVGRTRRITQYTAVWRYANQIHAQVRELLEPKFRKKRRGDHKGYLFFWWSLLNESRTVTFIQTTICTSLSTSLPTNQQYYRATPNQSHKTDKARFLHSYHLPNLQLAFCQIFFHSKSNRKRNFC